jgi:hypothetical protein
MRGSSTSCKTAATAARQARCITSEATRDVEEGHRRLHSSIVVRASASKPELKTSRCSLSDASLYRLRGASFGKSG